MVLRLEHVEDVRPECLRRFHHVRTSGIALPVDGKSGGAAIDLDARLDQRVDEFRRRQKIRLVGWNDVSAGIPVGRTAHDASVRRQVGRTRCHRASAPSSTATGVAPLWSGAVLRNRRR